MTKHTGHNHPATPAGRAACRKAMAAGTVVAPIKMTGTVARRMARQAAKADMVRGCKIQDVHCENCGSTDYEDINLGDQGYSACCNEIVNGQSDCRNHHG